jgi:hypothetical protein
MALSLSTTPVRALASALRGPTLLCCCTLSASGGLLRAQAPKRFPVTSGQVLAAMQGHTWHLDDVEVRIAAPVTATVPAPELEIESVSLRAGHEALVRVACRHHAECLPFFASAVWTTNEPPLAAYAKLARGAGATSGNMDEVAWFATEHTSGNVHTPPMIRSGSRATLLLDAGHIHIRLQVVCAQGGNLGDRIRVTTTDRKQVYVAEVLTPELLKGEL